MFLSTSLRFTYFEAKIPRRFLRFQEIPDGAFFSIYNSFTNIGPGPMIGLWKLFNNYERWELDVTNSATIEVKRSTMSVLL